MAKTVLHLIDTTGPGGAETVFIQLADLLRQRGYRSIVVIRGSGWVHDELVRRGLEPIIIPAKGSFAFRFLWRLTILIIAKKVDLIQSHLLGSNVYAAIAGILTRTPVVATYHGMVDVNPNERFKGIKLKIMQYGVSQYVAVSQHLTNDITKQKLLDPDKTTVIYNGVDTEKYQCGNSDDIRAFHNIPNDAVMIGSLGNVRPAKAYDVLLHAAAILLTEQPNTHFVIAGHKKQSLVEELDALAGALKIRDHIHFIGFQTESHRVLAQMDIFVLSSISEGFSIATIEAMASGLPVLATRCGGPEEIITHMTNGLLVAPGDPHVLAESLLALIHDPDLSKRLAQAGRDLAHDKFSLESMLSSYDSVYERTIKRVP